MGALDWLWPQAALGSAGALIARLWRHRRGTTALEFAIAGPVTIFLICMTIETGLVLFTQAALDNATRDAARLILTGQIQAAGGSAAPFKAQLCAEVSALIPCANLQINVQAASSFTALTGAVSTNGSGIMTGTGFVPGGPGQDVVVQIGYYRPSLIPGIWQLVGSDGDLLLTSVMAFQNEPYQ